MEAGYSYEWLLNQDILEIIRLWIVLLRRREFENALEWYNFTLQRIGREAREMRGTGKHRRQPTEGEIKAKERELKAKYFRTAKGEEWEKIKRNSYYNHITYVQDFFKQYKEQEQKRKNDKLTKNS